MAGRWRSSRRATTSGCSAISALTRWGLALTGCGLADDMRPSLHQHALDLEAVVEDDDVGGRADGQATEVLAPDDPRGHGAGRREGILELDAEAVQVAHRLHHGQC